MRPKLRLLSLLRAEVRVDGLSRMRIAGAEAYQLIDVAPPGSWERLAAWNAFLHQIYGDNLLGKEESESIPAETARIVTQLYWLAAAWLERATQLRESPASTLKVDPRTPLPHWRTPVRSRTELGGMRSTLDDARTRVASDLAAFAGAHAARERAATRLARIDARIETVDMLWMSRGSDEIRGAIGDALCEGLDGVSELGQLLARPELIDALAR